MAQPSSYEDEVGNNVLLFATDTTAEKFVSYSERSSELLLREDLAKL